MTSLDTVAHHIGHPVTITFSDGGTETGTLVAVRGTDLDVEQTYTAGGTHDFTATYSLLGDADTPYVTDVVRVAPQAEALF